MSLTRKLHQESTESHAAQQMHSTMGTDPALSQLYDRDLRDELTSKRSDDTDTDVPGDYEATEAKADATVTAQHETDEPMPRSDEASRRVADADWNRSTEEGTTDVARTDTNRRL